MGTARDHLSGNGALLCYECGSSGLLACRKVTGNAQKTDLTD